MLLMKDNGQVSEFDLDFGQDMDYGPAVICPAVGVCVQCDLCIESDSDSEGDGAHVPHRFIVVDKIDFVD